MLTDLTPGLIRNFEQQNSEDNSLKKDENFVECPGAGMSRLQVV